MIVKTAEGSLQRFAYLVADSAKGTLAWPAADGVHMFRAARNPQDRERIRVIDEPIGVHTAAASTTLLVQLFGVVRPPQDRTAPDLLSI